MALSKDTAFNGQTQFLCPCSTLNQSNGVCFALTETLKFPSRLEGCEIHGRSLSLEEMKTVTSLLYHMAKAPPNLSLAAIYSSLSSGASGIGCQMTFRRLCVDGRVTNGHATITFPANVFTQYKS